MLNIGIHPGMGMRIVRQVLPPSQPSVARPVPSVAEAVQEIQAPATTETRPAENKSSIKWWSKDSFSFKDILDMFNPLQHLPVISTLYRKLTGEGIGGVARIIGGAIYGRAGGIASMVSSVVNAVIGAVTGKDVGERVYAAIFGDATPPKNETSVARAALPQRALLSPAPVAVASIAGADDLTYRKNDAIHAAAVGPSAALANGKPQFPAAETSAKALNLAQRPMPYEAVSFLDLYDNMSSPTPAPAARKRLESEPEDESPFGPRFRFADRPE